MKDIMKKQISGRPKGRRTITKGISFDLALLNFAKKRARAKRRNFSAYINDLIFLDKSCQLEATILDEEK